MTDRYKLKFTKQSSNQIIQIISYISHNLLAPKAAMRLYSEIKEKTERLADFPESCTLVDREPWKSYEIRKLIVRNFIVYYMVDHVNQSVVITSVVYGKSNQLNKLKRMDFDD